MRREDKLADSIKALEANVALYPEDADAHEGLAESYMKAGRKEEAIARYKKSLQLNPQNSNGVDKLKKLGAKP